MTEKEKMLAGKVYDSSDGELTLLRQQAHALCAEYNSTLETETEKRRKILNKLLPKAHSSAYIQGAIAFDYGENTEIGENCYFNFNLTVLDCCPVKIGDNVLVGPNVSLLTPVHPLRYQQRNIRVKADGTAYDYEYAKPIVIGSNCWLAGNVTVIGGVTIGEGCVIGAGSVVTLDIPPHSLAVGNPCRVVRQITEADRLDGIDE